MMIIYFTFKSLAEYLAAGNKTEVARPDECAFCRRRDCFWKHTGYDRLAQDGDEEAVSIRIQRFYCKYCTLVVSCLFSFLAPYRRHSAKIVGESVERYVTAPAIVPLESYRKIALDHNCGRMSVWHWVNNVEKKSLGLHCQVQKEFILSGRPWQMLSAVPEQSTSPSSDRAKSVGKKEQLNQLFLLIEISKLFFGSTACVLEKLHAHFLKNIESKQLILTGRKIEQRAQQRIGRPLF
jgi:hypothetical protein